ncbi:MAG: hypothetical protein Q9188_005375 [Gyalolechia gomerana]
MNNKNTKPERTRVNGNNGDLDEDSIQSPGDAEDKVNGHPADEVDKSKEAEPTQEKRDDRDFQHSNFQSPRGAEDEGHAHQSDQDNEGQVDTRRQFEHTGKKQPGGHNDDDSFDPVNDVSPQQSRQATENPDDDGQGNPAYDHDQGQLAPKEGDERNEAEQQLLRLQGPNALGQADTTPEVHQGTISILSGSSLHNDPEVFNQEINTLQQVTPPHKQNNVQTATSGHAEDANVVGRAFLPSVDDDVNDTSTLIPTPSRYYAASNPFGTPRMATSSSTNSQVVCGDPFLTTRSIGRFTEAGESRAPCLQNHPGNMGLLIEAAQMPDLPRRPLRLTSRLIAVAELDEMLNEICSKFAIVNQKPQKRKALIELLSDFVGPGSYWKVRESMLKVVGAAGFGDPNDGSRRDNSVSYLPREDGRPVPPGPPACFGMFVEQWRRTQRFAMDTISPDVTRITKWHHEQLLFVYWQRMLGIWKGTSISDNDETVAVDEGNDTVTDDALRGRAEPEISDMTFESPPEETQALRAFVQGEYERRKSELHSRYDHAVRTRNSVVLKALVAPYLGFATPEDLAADGDTMARKKDMQKIFDKQWNNSMSRGKIAHILCRELGRGAVAIVKRKPLDVLGPPLLARILPIIARKLPSVCEVLEMVFKVYLDPIQSGYGLLHREVDRFLRIESIEQLMDECAGNANGLKGVFEDSSQVGVPYRGLPSMSSRPSEDDENGSHSSDVSSDHEDLQQKDQRAVVVEARNQQGWPQDFPPTPPPSGTRLRKRAASFTGGDRDRRSPTKKIRIEYYKEI